MNLELPRPKTGWHADMLQSAVGYLLAWGADKLNKDGRSLLQHLVSTHNILNEAGYSAEVALAGLYHPTYMTFFKSKGVNDSERLRIKTIIGDPAERSVYKYCLERNVWLDPLFAHPAQSIEYAHRDGAEKYDIERTLVVWLANNIDQIRNSRLSRRKLVQKRLCALLQYLNNLPENEWFAPLMSLAEKAVGETEVFCPVEFVLGMPNLPYPVRSDISLGGAASHRSVLYCYPFTTANGFGWQICAPIDADLLWDGVLTWWRPAGRKRWRELDVYVDRSAVQYFEQHAPESSNDYSRIPVLASGPEKGIVQVWTGLLATTDPGWGLLLRPLPNRARHPTFDVLEGLIETDWWFGPLVVPLHITKTHRVIKLRRKDPLLQIQPVTRDCYSDSTLCKQPPFASLSALNIEDWDRFNASVELRLKSHKPGAYRFEARRRQQQYEQRAGRFSGAGKQ
jgi:hypothetical protein